MEERSNGRETGREGTHEIVCQGETIALLPGRAVFRPRKRTLIVADTHFGKAAAFRSGGIPIPSGTTGTDLARLNALLSATHAERLVILGDFLHARTGRTQTVMDQLTAWRSACSTLAIDLVLGNHDRSAGPPPAEWNLATHTRFLCDPPFVYAHEPSIHPQGYALCGHLHPAYRLGDRLSGGQSYPCFWFTADYAVLPSFGSFTGKMQIRRGSEDRIYLVGPEQVIPLPRGSRVDS